MTPRRNRPAELTWVLHSYHTAQSEDFGGAVSERETLIFFKELNSTHVNLHGFGFGEAKRDSPAVGLRDG